MRRRLRLRTVLAVAALLVGAVPVIVLTIASKRSVEDMLHDSRQARFEVLASELAHSYDRFLALHMQTIESLAGDVAGMRLEPDGLTALLDRRLSRFTTFDGMSVFDARGAAIARAGTPPAALADFKVADRRWFRDAVATRRPTVEHVHTSRATGRDVVALAVPALARSGAVVAVVAGTIEVDVIRALAAGVAHGRTAEAAVVTEEGHVLAGGSWAGADVSRSHPAFWAWLTGGAVGRMPDTTGGDGVARLAAFATVAATGWKVWVSQERAELADEVRATYPRAIALAAIALLGGVGLAVATGLVIVRPIERLSRTASAIAAGDLDTRAAVSGTTETASLGRDFNHMADAIAERVERERASRARLEAAVRAYSRLVERVNAGDLSARVPVDGELSALSENLNRIVAALQAKVEDARAAQAKVQALIDASPLAIWVVDTDGRVQLWSPAAEAIFGWKAADVVGHAPPTVPDDPANPFGLAMHQARAGGFVGEMPQITRDGKRIDVRVSAAPARNGRDHAGPVVVLVEDVTERIATERRLREQSRELARSNADLERLAYVASHDLQEPLRMVAGYTELLGRRYRGKLDADADEFIGYAVDGAKRMQSLISDLLAFARVGSRGSSMAPVDSGTVLDAALANLATVVRERQATVTRGPLPVVTADGLQLAQVFQNLVANAIKFSGDGVPEVHVSAARYGDAWAFSVRDNGPGIAPEHHARIFEIFRRLNPRSEAAGNGIGLAICKRVVEHHGGRIWIDPAPGAGSTFVFTIQDAKDGGA